ncbi:hypothetical protein HUG15_12200 [Salicibibacter cibarius]|uniref:Uncharacterized protein n=1 Tax=Salicibibacter cibarius TaxID=2743000 RepID=A0A7T6Z3B8_9BACI|nr:hypothetical protein [Salicibibacter cibarius]QQK76243.1 hypothetical protein HUG15_12200 [Salicibibacter cibarius]
MARRQRKNGRVKTPQRRFCARRLDRSSAKSEAMEAASRLQLIYAVVQQSLFIDDYPHI